MTLRELSTLFTLVALLSGVAAPDAVSQGAPVGAEASSPVKSATSQDGAADDEVAKDGKMETEDTTEKSATPTVDVTPPTSTLRGWAQELERAGTRLVYYRESPAGAWSESPGQVAITYSKVPWRKEYEDSLDKLLDEPSPDAPKIQRWRLGKDLWSTLDARLPMTLGGVEITPGYYYLALELDRTTTPRFHLCLLDPTAVTEQRRDAWHLDREDIPIFLRVPLTHARVEKELAKKELGIVFLVDPEDPTHADLHISFGHHTATTQVVVNVTADGK